MDCERPVLTVAEYFERVAERERRDPLVERGKMLQANGLKLAGKFFAFVSSRGELVVKLPEARVNELVANGKGAPLNPRGTGKPMREWVCLTPRDVRACARYVDEARAFVSETTS
jgi:hypothetical protein